ncbi:ATP-binding cassette domain-containing protein [Halomonas sp. MCCC 1A17488]|uniref:ATP-binding cassette domain-containing protein n=1 Tax=Billgrantia sulfidoxydans TaxID=2733484 RepID=A0ABX7W8D0_9GAMM|nr:MULTISPECIES: ATP-binding cassette domain-containing protein [Halomonas]MCE8017984.1 ATP-binding cassette domain-containing protein [Halomonas sp. MCCC 1A17488]MCG3241317.1 ATP-binding cassette domain-containing protein [Halomonas sp. MCCC 1A17488]QPP48716.1 ATP-binding cassette domain-containing protein [Halomonas sp. SS10-MC5]QTP56055.1 ATP-binding cassette domain-containing protein [Halomonas sulfidoxydans]
MLELDVTRHGTPRTILGRLSLRVAAGDRICLLGPSGSGKTTLLNLIAGLDAPSSGGGVTREAALRIGYLFQEHRLLPWRTLRQNLLLVGAAPEDVDTLLARVDLAGHGDDLPDQLSLGMARRAALARCLAVEPDLLLLDEPFASLDSRRAQALRACLGALLEQHPQMAMICVTHDAQDAARLANRVWYLDGRPAQLRWDERLAQDSDRAAVVQTLSRLADPL